MPKLDPKTRVEEKPKWVSKQIRFSADKVDQAEALIPSVYPNFSELIRHSLNETIRKEVLIKGALSKLRNAEDSEE